MFLMMCNSSSTTRVSSVSLVSAECVLPAGSVFQTTPTKGRANVLGLLGDKHELPQSTGCRLQKCIHKVCVLQGVFAQECVTESVSKRFQNDVFQEPFIYKCVLLQ